MKKRLKKKLGNRYNVLKRAKRQRQKRRGNRIIDFALVPMGINDKLGFDEDGYTRDYPYATHWYAEIMYSRVAVFENKRVNYMLTVQPCTEHGGTDTEGALQFMLYNVESKKIITNIFNRLVDDLKSDNFWDNEDYI